MRFLKVLGVIALVAILVYVFKFRNMGQETVPEQVESVEEHNHNHDHDHDHEHITEEYDHEKVQEDHENKPYYQGEIINIEIGGGYTYLEIMESTGMSFWIVVNKVEAKTGDFVMFQEDLVAENFHSKALDKTFEEIMFATNLQYRVSE